jgi:hypothetical protein
VQENGHHVQQIHGTPPIVPWTCTIDVHFFPSNQSDLRKSSELTLSLSQTANTGHATYF